MIELRIWDKQTNQYINQEAQDKYDHKLEYGEKNNMTPTRDDLFEKEEWYTYEWDMLGFNCPNRFKERLVFEQYTGLEDKNGVKIFDGDIILTCTKKKCQISFKDGGFAYNYKLSEHMEDDNWIHFGGHNHLDTVLDCEVIGNIHQDTSLLEEN